MPEVKQAFPRSVIDSISDNQPRLAQVAFADRMRSLVPYANGLDTQRETGLAAARDGAVNGSLGVAWSG